MSPTKEEMEHRRREQQYTISKKPRRQEMEHRRRERQFTISKKPRVPPKPYVPPKREVVTLRREQRFTADVTKRMEALKTLHTQGIISKRVVKNRTEYSMTVPVSDMTDKQLRLADKAGFIVPSKTEIKRAREARGLPAPYEVQRRRMVKRGLPDLKTIQTRLRWGIPIFGKGAVEGVPFGAIAAFGKTVAGAPGAFISTVLLGSVMLSMAVSPKKREQQKYRMVKRKLPELKLPDVETVRAFVKLHPEFPTAVTLHSLGFATGAGLTEKGVSDAGSLLKGRYNKYVQLRALRKPVPATQKGWELYPSRQGDMWFKMGKNYGKNIPDEVMKDILRQQKVGKFKPIKYKGMEFVPDKLGDVWFKLEPGYSNLYTEEFWKEFLKTGLIDEPFGAAVRRHAYGGAGAAQYPPELLPFLDITDESMKGILDPRFGEFLRLRNLDLGGRMTVSPFDPRYAEFLRLSNLAKRVVSPADYSSLGIVLALGAGLISSSQLTPAELLKIRDLQAQLPSIMNKLDVPTTTINIPDVGPVQIPSPPSRPPSPHIPRRPPPPEKIKDKPLVRKVRKLKIKKVGIPKFVRPKRFRVTFQYDENSERIKVPAKSFRQAYGRANAKRKSKMHPNLVEIERLK